MAAFQSTLPRRERHFLWKISRFLRLFQSTLPRRERRKLSRPLKHTVSFQSTLPRRERRIITRVHHISTAFQSTLPRRERPQMSWLSCAAQNFNPRSREGSDAIKQQDEPQDGISIHAPAKGATRDEYQRGHLRDYISIHAPAKGATSATWRVSVGVTFQSTLPRRERLSATWRVSVGVTFQSTLPRRERRREYRAGTNAILISIHAPAKGATGEDQVCYISQGHFNPRSREGSDMRDDKADIKDRLFQSTLPRRERHTLTPYLYIDTKISIHAPAKGATVIFLHRFHI